VITLSNGTQITEHKMDNGATEAVVVPDGRLMTDPEWEEYVTYIRALSNEGNRARLANRLPVINCQCHAEATCPKHSGTGKFETLRPVRAGKL